MFDPLSLARLVYNLSLKALVDPFALALVSSQLDVVHGLYDEWISNWHFTQFLSEFRVCSTFVVKVNCIS